MVSYEFSTVSQSMNVRLRRYPCVFFAPIDPNGDARRVRTTETRFVVDPVLRLRVDDDRKA
jgi:hypothetical protein